MAHYFYPDLGYRRNIMTEKTCAACDFPLDANFITVKIGGKNVEVCCDECAQKLKDGLNDVPA
jgi:hypothetical protein